MMNKGVIRSARSLLVLGLLSVATPVLAAGVMEGRVLDVFNGKVTLQVTAEDSFQDGDRIELSYMAGPMEMLIGQYEVIQRQGPVVFAKQISLTMPPIKDMNVRVSRADTAARMIVPDSGAMDPLDRDPRFLEANTGAKKEEQLPPPAGKEKAAPIAEPVVEVLGPNEGISAAAPPSPGTEKISPADSFPSPGLFGESPFFRPEANLGPVSPLPAPGKYVLGIEIMNNNSIQGQMYTAAPVGIRVVSVFPRSAAEKNGIKTGDVISVINKNPVEDIAHFIRTLNASGGKVVLEIQRNGKMIKKTVVLQERTP
jgi:hypothetical protein